jgi:hypothetical protein
VLSERRDDQLRIAPRQRAQRFWRAHGCSRAHMTVLYALATNPALSWTARGLSTWYGVPVADVRQAVGEFVTAGVVVKDRDMADAVRWNRALDWARPSTKYVRSIVQHRWLEIPDRRYQSSASIVNDG